ncbi:MAG TPA: hypothetical protein VG425_07795 [Casimicrobiaceae bacterium]|jgi:hypothetical protein|nr:hypothetical protein [Casimicrobiaceae bacterium]
MKVLNRHRESRGQRMGRSFAGKPQDIESEIGRAKPETNNLSRKCDSVSPGDHVITWIATKKRLSNVFEATTDWTRGLDRVARPKHAVGFPVETKKRLVCLA